MGHRAVLVSQVALVVIVVAVILLVMMTPQGPTSLGPGVPYLLP